MPIDPRQMNGYDRRGPWGQAQPWEWGDTQTIDGAAPPWNEAPIGSTYYDMSAGVTYHKVANAGATADWATASQAVSSVIAGNLSFSGTPTLQQPPKTSSGVGAVVSGKCSAVEYGDGVLHKTVLTLTLTGANDLDLADDDHGTGVKVYDFPEGRILLLGATINASAVTNDAFEANPNDVYCLSAGSVVGADDADLTSTEADIIPKATLDSVGNTELTLAWKGALAASAQFDGTTTALDLFINAAVAGASLSKALTIAITGTLTVVWINLGDY